MRFSTVHFRFYVPCTPGTIIPLGDSVRQVAYVECSCGCLASRVTNDSSKYKCSWCKRVYTLRKDHKTAR
ncbi:excinuclease ABC subunit C [Enterococcus faecalis]|nr:excinuclease ABC subunit C [Enterococcus faecalis]